MKITGVIIAGGQSKRMGKDKLSIRFQGDTLLNKAIALLKKFSDEIMISANRSDLDLKYRIIADKVTNIGPLGGIYSALLEAKTQKILIIPVDMPLINEEIIACLLKNSDKEALINLYKTQNRTQMLVGLYDKKLLPIIEKQIENKQYKLRDLLQLSANNLIDGSTFEELFVNANTPGELQKLKQKYER